MVGRYLDGLGIRSGKRLGEIYHREIHAYLLCICVFILMQFVHLCFIQLQCMYIFVGIGTIMLTLMCALYKTIHCYSSTYIYIYILYTYKSQVCCTVAGLRTSVRRRLSSSAVELYGCWSPLTWRVSDLTSTQRRFARMLYYTYMLLTYFSIFLLIYFILFILLNTTTFILQNIYHTYLILN